MFYSKCLMHTLGAGPLCLCSVLACCSALGGLLTFQYENKATGCGG